MRACFVPGGFWNTVCVTPLLYTPFEAWSLPRAMPSSLPRGGPNSSALGLPDRGGVMRLQGAGSADDSCLGTGVCTPPVRRISFRMSRPRPVPACLYVLHRLQQ